MQLPTNFNMLKIPVMTDWVATFIVSFQGFPTPHPTAFIGFTIIHCEYTDTRALIFVCILPCTDTDVPSLHVSCQSLYDELCLMQANQQGNYGLPEIVDYAGA